MIYSEKVLVCDNCGNELRYEDTSYYGGHPASGWIELKIHGGSTRLEALRAKSEFNFCCRECVGEWANKDLEKRKYTINGNKNE